MCGRESGLDISAFSNTLNLKEATMEQLQEMAFNTIELTSYLNLKITITVTALLFVNLIVNVFAKKRRLHNLFLRIFFSVLAFLYIANNALFFGAYLFFTHRHITPLQMIFTCSTALLALLSFKIYMKHATKS